MPKITSMRILRSRPALALGAVAACVALGSTLSPSASAAQGPTLKPQKPQLVDPKGDVQLLGAGFDVVSATLTTSGRAEVDFVGKKKVTTYTPQNLVVKLELAAPPALKNPAKYAVTFDISGCGNTTFTYTPNLLISQIPLGLDEDSYEFFPCGGDGSTPIFNPVSISGNVITFTVGLDEIPVGKGAVFSNIQAYTAYAEPVTGVIDTAVVGYTFDSASTTKTWKLG